jgi:hypothetical protein
MAKSVSTRAATKKPAPRKSPNVVETATGVIKLPVSFKEFAKKPTAAIAFICITGISYLYVDLKKTNTERYDKQDSRIERLEYRDSVKTEVIRKLDSSSAAATALFQMNQSLRKIQNP